MLAARNYCPPTILIWVICFFFAIQLPTNADSFTQNLNLGESFGQTPFFVENAFIREESFGPHVRYWQPTSPNVVGVVTYKFAVPFNIGNAEIEAGVTAYTVGADVNYDSGAETYLDISTDNVNWTNIASQTPANASGSGVGGPWDISSLVAGSNVVYARSRMLMTTNYSGFGTSQFLRQGQPYEVGGFTASGSEPPKIYWTDVDGATGTHTLKRSAGDGSSIVTIASGLHDPRGLALDLQHGFAYWAEPGALRISRTTLDGNGPVEHIVPSDNGAADVELDIANGKIYWTDSNDFQINHGGLSGQIRRANLDGSNAESLVTGLVNPAAMVLDPVQGKMYWTELQRKSDGLGSIQRANLDGSNVETLLTGIDEANGLAIDRINGKLYWSELTTHRIQSANLDGSDLQDVVTGLDHPTTVDLDLRLGKIYWTNSVGQEINHIARANLDGTSVETLISGVGAPWGIAVAPEPSSAALLVMAGIMSGVCGFGTIPFLL